MANNVNVTNRGFQYICEYLNGANPGGANWPQPKIIGWGGANGYNAAATVLPGAAPTTTQGTGQWSDVGPFQEFGEARVTGSGGMTTATVASGTVGYLLTGTITAAGAESVGEAFIAMATTKPAVFTVTTNNVTNVAAALTVNTSGALAGQYYQMNNEVILIASTAASNVWNITRAQNGSAAGTAKTTDTLTYGNPPGGNADTGSNPLNGDMFAHAGFQALALNTSDSIAFTWVVNVTS